MTKRTAKFHPLPKWFHLSKYELTNDITNEELVDQVLYAASNLDWGEDPVTTEDSLGRLEASLGRLMGRVNGTPFRMAKLALMNLEPGTAYVKEVSPSSSTKVASSITPHIFPLAWFDILNRRKPLNLLDIGVNLAEATDVEILAELERLLPLWRKELALPEPTKNEAGKVGPSVIKRIIDYKVIPILELMVWGKNNKFAYSAEQLSRVLFPEEAVTAKHMTDTRIPFALGFANRGYQDMLHLWLSQTGGDGKRNGERRVRDEYPDLT